MKRALGLALVAALLISGTTLASKPYATTLIVMPGTVQSGDLFDVSGCGFDVADGNIIVGFTGGGWGSALDSNGCFLIEDIVALSGDSLPPGIYDVSAYQYIHGRWRVTGLTTIEVIP